jgi:putative aldouronate transport system substrate-binding protein
MSVFFGYSATIEDYRTNEFTLWLENLTNIKLDFVVAPTDAPQRLALMMSAGTDIPDMIATGLTMASTMSYGSQGLIIPLDDLIDRHSVSLVKILEARPHLLNIMRAPDGKTYHLPGLNECWHCEYVPKPFVAVEWMEKLGLEMPETTEEFYRFLKAFKEGDPNETGVDDVVPLTGSDRWWAASVDQFLMQPFLYYPSRTGLWVENEKIYAPFVSEGWREGVRYMRRLYAEGLIDSEVFVQDGTQFAALVLK